MAALLSIGEFSRLTHVSVKALRHYHDLLARRRAGADAGGGGVAAPAPGACAVE